MPRNTLTISVFIASPTDVNAERDVVERAVLEWNSVQGLDRNVRFEVLRSETSVSAGFSSDGQAVVNSQIPPFDVLVALFWTRLGSSTPRAASGTVEEYERTLARYKNGENVEIAFLFKDAQIDPRSVDMNQMNAVMEYEISVQNDGAFTKRFVDDDVLRFEINLLLDRAARRFMSDGLKPIVPSIIGTPNTGATNLHHQDDELGLFDIVDNLSRHSEDATSALSDISAQLGILGEITSNAASDLSEISNTRALTPQEAKPHVSRVAKGMNNFSEILDRTLPVFAENSVALASDVRQLIDVSYDFVKSDPAAGDQLNSFRGALLDMLSGMDSSITSHFEYLDTIKTLQRTTSEFNAARRRLVKNIETMIGAIESAKSLIEQAITELELLISTS